ncbi:hypothetical protein NIES2109_62700 (plasmid) [Nostoc sp. HK-01]|nr:hypothetical protein NIES2109_62700 [Nostoc sp. HK-01]
MTVRHRSWKQFLIFGVSLLPALTIFFNSPEGLNNLSLRHLLIHHLLDDAIQLFNSQFCGSIGGKSSQEPKYGSNHKSTHHLISKKREKIGIGILALRLFQRYVVGKSLCFLPLHSCVTLAVRLFSTYQ